MPKRDTGKQKTTLHSAQQMNTILVNASQVEATIRFIVRRTFGGDGSSSSNGGGGSDSNSFSVQMLYSVGILTCVSAVSAVCVCVCIMYIHTNICVYLCNIE